MTRCVQDTGNYAASNGRRASSKVPQHQWHWVAITLEMGTKVKVYMGGRGAASGEQTGRCWSRRSRR